MSPRGYGTITDYNGIDWVPGENIKKVLNPQQAIMDAIPSWVKYGAIAVVAGIVIYGIYSLTR